MPRTWAVWGINENAIIKTKELVMSSFVFHVY